MRRVAGPPLPVLLFLPVLILPGCGPEETGAVPGAVRDTLPDGTPRVRHAALPGGGVPLEAPVLEPDLVLGSVDGAQGEVFGDVRAVEARPDGTILVLDHQASEVRVFGPDGEYRGVLVGPGEGPAEITAANGMVLDDDGVLWVYDYRKMTMIGVGPEGDEVDRVPTPVRSYGYAWSGALDDAGRFWKLATHRVDERRRPPEEGLQEVASRRYMKSLDIESEAVDSVYLGTGTFPGYVAQVGNGWMFASIPFAPTPQLVVDPAGGFWVSSAEAYRVARLDEAGDTVLVLEADVAPLPVTPEDRAAHLEGIEHPGAREANEAAMDFAPSARAVLDQLLVDERGRLWVRRVQREGEPYLYDVFARDGAHLATLRLPPSLQAVVPPRVRDGHLYAVTTDELDVPRVVRVPLPPALSGRGGA